MLHKVVITAILYCISLGNISHADTIIQNYVPNAKICGKDRYTYIMFDVYDATLYAPQGQWIDNEPYALTLRYLRSLKGKKIAQRSAEEMRKIGFKDEIKLAGWYSQMKEIFPDVRKGNTLTGIYTPGQETRFYKDDKHIGTIQDPAFGRWFFGIWLAEKTSAPEFRQNLIGKK